MASVVFTITTLLVVYNIPLRSYRKANQVRLKLTGPHHLHDRGDDDDDDANRLGEETNTIKKNKSSNRHCGNGGVLGVGRSGGVGGSGVDGAGGVIGDGGG
jgi:hypothetical protein